MTSTGNASEADGNSPVNGVTGNEAACGMSVEDLGAEALALVEGIAQLAIALRPGKVGDTKELSREKLFCKCHELVERLESELRRRLDDEHFMEGSCHEQGTEKGKRSTASKEPASGHDKLADLPEELRRCFIDDPRELGSLAVPASSVDASDESEMESEWGTEIDLGVDDEDGLKDDEEENGGSSSAVSIMEGLFRTEAPLFPLNALGGADQRRRQTMGRAKATLKAKSRLRVLTGQDLAEHDQKYAQSLLWASRKALPDFPDSYEDLAPLYEARAIWDMYMKRPPEGRSPTAQKKGQVKAKPTLTRDTPPPHLFPVHHTLGMRRF